MGKLLATIVTGMFVGTIQVAAYGADAADAAGANQAGAHDSARMTQDAQSDASYAKKVQQDFDRVEKRLVNNYEVTLQKCYSQRGQARQDCRKQAKAILSDDLRRERVAYHKAMQEGRATGSSGNAGSSRSSGSTNNSR